MLLASYMAQSSNYQKSRMKLKIEIDQDRGFGVVPDSLWCGSRSGKSHKARSWNQAIGIGIVSQAGPVR